jgi:hypothetical protein
MGQDHSYEEIRKAAIDILRGKETGNLPTQYKSFGIRIAEVVQRRDPSSRLEIGYVIANPQYHLSDHDELLFQEMFWDLFRQGIITLGLDCLNEHFPWFRVSSFGKAILENQDPYFFHDVSTYEAVIKQNVPDIDEVTLLYLKEAMQAFMSGCMLSSSVILGVAAEHSFEKLLDAIEGNAKYKPLFSSVNKERSILPKLNKFKQILDQHKTEMTPEIREDIDTNFSGIIAIIRNFRNESGHPCGKIISREQCYILLQLFIPYCKKIYQLKNFFEEQ